MNFLVGGILMLSVVTGIQRRLLDLPSLGWRYSGVNSNDDPRSKKNWRHVVKMITHRSTNAYCFPVLFFFSALYYTDVISTLSVLVTYWTYLYALDPSSSRSILSGLKSRRWVLLCGLVSLTFRQTNVFWVAAFLGGLETVRTVECRTETWSTRSDVDSRLSVVQVFQRIWHENQVYDPLATEASIEGGPSIKTWSHLFATDRLIDYLKTSLSLAIGAVAHIKTVCISLVPYGVIVGTFATFVIWNGGVVLGEFHIYMYSTSTRS